ncbi:hypothetical protein ACF0H5_011695 [Mactra antiquata]
MKCFSVCSLTLIIVLYYGILCTDGFFIDCDRLCPLTDTTSSTFDSLCSCVHLLARAENSSTPTTTESICDYLCSIQEGGSACDCSVSLIPG